MASLARVRSVLLVSDNATGQAHPASSCRVVALLESLIIALARNGPLSESTRHAAHLGLSGKQKKPHEMRAAVRHKKRWTLLLSSCWPTKQVASIAFEQPRGFATTGKSVLAAPKPCRFSKAFFSLPAATWQQCSPFLLVDIYAPETA